MKVKDIWKEKAGVVIPEFTARLIKVYPPSQPSEKQAKAGIHRQTLEGVGADGTQIKIVLMKEHQHIPTSEAGRLYTFKSTNDDNGVQFDRLHLSVAGDEENAVTLRLPDTATVDRPVATNWHADPADAVPFIG